MEDEDGEGKIIDMWNILEEQQLKDSTLGNALRHSIDDVYTDVIEEQKQLIRYNSIIAKDSPGRNTVANPKLTFKGFKKRILAQAREIHTAGPKNSIPETQQSAYPNARGGKDKRTEGKRERKITEYAQYLGLQPSARYKCSKCHTWSFSGPNTKQNPCTCNSSMTPMPSTSESSTSMSHSASNFKITRKVYLCAACGTYFENWNLFLHMRDIHKRHICLFCLGMFGQAERLSYHLMKKHSVPEMAFTSMEDFYNAFKGSCYLVCCSCEKVFSETDDFFNHYCSLTLKQDVTDTGTPVCTICRQSGGTHASTCSFALSSDTDRDLYASATPLSVADATHADNASPMAILPPEKTTNLGGKGPPRKAIKHKSKHSEGDGAQNSRQPKLIASTRKLGAKTRCNENQLDCNLDIQREITNNLPRDTVTETIMEVSRYTGRDSDENDENDEQVMNKDMYNNRDKESGETSSTQNCQLDRNEPYDSVTETIMEVSRYTGEEEKNEREEDSTCIADECTSHIVEKMDIENSEICDKNDIDLVRSINSRPPSPVQWETEKIAMADAKANATCEPENDIEFCGYDSPQNVQSPVNRSLFSPQHESHALDPQSEEKENVDDVEKNEEDKSDAMCATESQASVSFNAVPTSDRSLIIKICNRNSQFSVATTTATSKKSEENNNAQGSTSNDKTLNGSKTERDINGDDEANNELDDSDSDSDKLAVVDSNQEEDEEAEDGEEAEEADEIEEIEGDRCNDARDDDNRENQEGNGTETTDRETFAVTTMPSHDISIEKFVNNESEGTARSVASDQTTKDDTIGIDGSIALAGEDAPCIDLNVEGTLDSMDLEELLKRCIEAASPICVYCNHARHIAINGKQLGLHMLAEHKFQPQHPAIIIQMEQFTTRVRRSLDELEFRYFNLNTYTSANGTYNVPEVLIYECFHCRFHSAIHKELYLHNRKMHQKTILICIMCKSTFYSYSELLCHLCPGIYSPNVNLRYRCCLCSVASLPSAFRLMVHLRKRHHVCDVCLESTGNQQRLSNHVWKHKLHHLCYRCGIAYRNKPDITKHLFWKHGTESVLCRKCLQKKWPHIYHFCIPPTAFVCEECGLSFGRAVALKVHKRLHSGDSPYGCDECTERFISRKLLAKHQASHKEPKPEDIDVNMMDVIHAPPTERDEKSDTAAATTTDGIAVTGVTGIETTKNVKEAVKRVDVYDLPPLNLSSESDTDSEEEKVASTEKLLEKEKATEDASEKKNETTEELSATAIDDVAALNNDIAEVERNEEEKKQEARIMDGIWDNFKTYAASLDVEESAKNIALKESVPETDAAYLRSIILADHDYCIVYSSEKKSEDQAISKDDDAKDEHDGVKSKRSPSPDTPNLNTECDSDANKRKAKTPKKKKRSGSTSSTSDSSSDTDSSSCSCGTNCSCSSSSSGSSSSSSSSSDSDSSTSESSPRKQSSNRKEKHSKKEREVEPEDKLESVEPENKPEITVENGLVIPELTSEPPTITVKPLLRESDLETEETETDEDFYDEHPQLLANKLLSEKRNQLLLLAAVAPASTSISPLTPAMDQPSTPLNNGILDAEKALPESIMMTTEDQQQPQQQQKRKAKTKKRRKGERGAKRNATTVESIKLNIPKAFYRKNPGFVASSPAMLHPNSRASTPNQLSTATCNDHHGGVGGAMEMMQQQQQTSSITTVIGVPNQHIGAGGTETENKRVSKRKRVPKRFYGDSSDDEPQDKQPAFNRWRKSEIPASPSAFASPLPPTAITSPNPKSIVSPRYSLGGKSVIQTYTNRSQVIQMEQAASQQQAALSEGLPRITTPASATESDDPAESSSDSSESETEDVTNQTRINRNNLTMPSTINTSAAERPGKIYCYCRCPYDEVSEMIACDGEDCRIEWFHFECVGIMVPPKGKWYCPDCRKKHGIVQNDDYCD